MFVMDDSVHISETEKLDSAINHELWKTYQIGLYVLRNLGYYIEEINGLNFTLILKDSFVSFSFFHFLSIFWKKFRRFSLKVSKVLSKQNESDDDDEEDYNETKQKKLRRKKNC